MPSYVITPSEQAAAPIEGTTDLFPVRRIYCIGRNYAEHAIEMGHDPDKEAPFFFQKNPDNIDASGDFPYPAMSSDVHFELELVVALKSGGRNIPEAEAMTHVYGYGLALDMTRRDLQSEMKKAGRPWEIGKAFERSAPISPLIPAEKIGQPTEGEVTLHVNGELRQHGNLNQMIWKIPEMISYLSRYYDIAAGDLILSGTPAGVGAVAKGDVMVGKIEGVGQFEVKVI